MVIVTKAEDMGSYIHKSLSEWWSEESEYLYKRIERWAAFARGYNRLKSVHLSKARMTMREKADDLYWDNLSPNNYCITRSRLPDERRGINCCGTFNYQSNSHFNSTCLETYRYDHSIYFQTIGDIKNSKKKLSDDDADQNGQERDIDEDYEYQYYVYCKGNQDELNLRMQCNDNLSSTNVKSCSDNHFNVVTPNGDVRWDLLYETRPNSSKDFDSKVCFTNIWPIIDITKITEEVSNKK